MVLPGYKGRWQRAESNLARIKAGRWQGQDSPPEPSSQAGEGFLESQFCDMGLLVWLEEDCKQWCVLEYV